MRCTLSALVDVDAGFKRYTVLRHVLKWASGANNEISTWAVSGRMMNEVVDWGNYSDLKLDHNRYEFCSPLAL